jgi:hypothetical protein
MFSTQGVALGYVCVAPSGQDIGLIFGLRNNYV